MKQPASSRQREAAFRDDLRKGLVKDKASRASSPTSAPGPAEPSSDGKSADAAPKPRTAADRQKRRRFLGQYVRWLWPHRFALLGLFLLALLAAGLDMVWPLAIRHVIDGVLLNEDLAAD